MANKFFSRRIAKTMVLLAVVGCSLFSISSAFAADAGNVGNIANTITKSFSSIGALMLGTAYIAGIGFAIASIFKFKQHRDNPTQVPVGTPIVLLMVGICLIFLPGIVKSGGTTVFGSGAKGGGFNGEGADSLTSK